MTIRTDLYTKAVLTAIAVLLVIAVVQPFAKTPVVRADSIQPEIYIEPGTSTLRDLQNGGQVQGRVVVNLRTGDIYGFPTFGTELYPIEPLNPDPPVSKPMYLGKFDFGAMTPSIRKR